MMKNGVYAPEQDGGDSKRRRTTEEEAPSAQEPSISSQIAQVARNAFSMILGTDTSVESSNAQSTPFDQTPSLQTDEASAPAAENTAMQECFANPKIFVHILRFANNPSASRVCQNFYNPQEEALRLDYNQNKEPHRPDFYYDEDKNSNEATAEQQVEVEYLLRHEADILGKTENAKEVKACFEKLKKAHYLNIKPVETIKFIAREKFLDELNAAIINAKILKSKRNDATILYCQSCHLTRFSGKVITQHLDYFKALRKLYLVDNQLQSLPHEIGQLVVLQKLFLGSNQLQSLPREIGQLVALQGLFLGKNRLQSLPPEIGQLVALQGLDLSINRLQSLPREIGQLVMLLELYLGYNQLKKLPDTIGLLVALKELVLRNNQLQSLPPEIGQLTATLQLLALDNNQLQTLPDDLRENILKNYNFQTTTKAQVLASQRKPNPSNDEETKKARKPS